MATIPQLDLPSAMNKPGPWVVQPINPSSDGQPAKWRKAPYRSISNDSYRVKIGGLWAEQKGIAVPGINYFLDKLPHGYQLQDVPKPGDDSVRYKRLFGHPSGRFFDSQPKFFVHFLWLMDGMKGDCLCVLCNKDKKPAPSTKSASISKPRPRAPKEIPRRDITVDLGKRAKPVPNYFDKRLYEQRDKRTVKSAESTLPTDEEGTPDIYKTLIQLLYRHRESRKVIDEDLEEKASLDWRAEHNDKYGDSFKILSSHLTHILLQHGFVPRIGELVLWCPDHPDDVGIVYNPKDQSYQFYSPDRQQFHGFPRWRGGVVTQTPSTDEHVDFPDVLCVVDRKDSLNRAGFRVETFPDPNDDTDKSASKQYKYVPLRQIRPLNQWRNLLRGIPDPKLDPSIRYALTCSVSVSLLEKYRFVGKWPEASIFCKGIYVGPELLIQGDAVRILPSPHESSTGSSQCTDVLVISSIRLHLHDIDQEHIKDASPGICTRFSITIIGTAYTLDPARAYLPPSATPIPQALPQPIPPETIKYALPTVGAAAYGNWYALHGPKQKYEITHDRVLGRLYESGAMGMWTGTLGNRRTCDEPPSLSYDLDSVLAGRQYGTLTDERTPQAPPGVIRWFWADTRVQALSVETINGIEVGAYDSVRDARTLQAWRARLKIIDGIHTPADMKDSMLARQKGRPKGSRVVGGMVVGPDEEEEESEDGEEVETPPRGSLSEAIRSKKGVGGMVGAGAALEDEDEEEEAGVELRSDDNDDPDDDEEDEDEDEEEINPYSSKVSIMSQQHPDWNPAGFIIPSDPDINMVPHPRRLPPPAPPTKRSTAQLSPEFLGPTKARKSTGGSRISSLHAGRYDSSVTPAITQASSWKGKGRAQSVVVAGVGDWDPEIPFRSVEPGNSVLVDDESDGKEGDGEREEVEDDDGDDDEEGLVELGGFVEPEPKDDEDYDEDASESEDEDEGEEDADGDREGEEERVRTLQKFQKHTFDRLGRKMRF